MQTHVTLRNVSGEGRVYCFMSCRGVIWDVINLQVDCMTTLVNLYGQSSPIYCAILSRLLLFVYIINVVIIERVVVNVAFMKGANMLIDIDGVTQGVTADGTSASISP